MKSLRFLAFAALAVIAQGSEQLLESEEIKKPEYSCPPGPKSGWGIRGDLSCEVLETPIPALAEEKKLIAGFLQEGSCYQFTNANETDKMFRHRDHEMFLDQIVQNDTQFEGDSTFKVIASLKSGLPAISFQSVNRPSMHIRHGNWLFWVNEGTEDDKLFMNDSEFKISPKTAGGNKGI